MKFKTGSVYFYDRNLSSKKYEYEIMEGVAFHQKPFGGAIGINFMNLYYSIPPGFVAPKTPKGLSDLKKMIIKQNRYQIKSMKKSISKLEQEIKKYSK